MSTGARRLLVQLLRLEFFCGGHQLVWAEAEDAAAAVIDQGNGPASARATGGVAERAAVTREKCNIINRQLSSEGYGWASVLQGFVISRHLAGKHWSRDGVLART